MNWLKKIWASLQPDPYFYIATVMELEGYTDLEISLEIDRLKAWAVIDRLTSR
jgi:hypothetical protein